LTIAVAVVIKEAMVVAVVVVVLLLVIVVVVVTVAEVVVAVARLLLHEMRPPMYMSFQVPRRDLPARGAYLTSRGASSHWVRSGLTSRYG
jgi:hypothetical protein